MLLNFAKNNAIQSPVSLSESFYQAQKRTKEQCALHKWYLETNETIVQLKKK